MFRALVLTSRPKPGTSVSCSAARPKRLPIVRVERAESREELVGGRKASIQAKAHLVDVVDLFAGGGEILNCRIGGGQRPMTDA